MVLGWTNVIQTFYISSSCMINNDNRTWGWLVQRYRLLKVTCALVDLNRILQLDCCLLMGFSGTSQRKKTLFCWQFHVCGVCINVKCWLIFFMQFDVSRNWEFSTNFYLKQYSQQFRMNKYISHWVGGGTTSLKVATASVLAKSLGREGATLLFIWSCVCGYFTNVSPTLTLVSAL